MKNNLQDRIYDHIQARGISRRDFMKFCATVGAALGLNHSAVAQIAHAMETKGRIPVVWLHFQECTGCSESFLRSEHPIVADIILDKVSLDYSETLQAASGEQAEAALQETITKHRGKYLLLIEGSVPTASDGCYCVVGGRSALDRLHEVAAGAKAIIAWGNCAGSGGVQSAFPNPTHTVPVNALIKDKPVVNVQGCPPIPDVMAGVLVHLLTYDRLPQLDALGRPKAFYSRRIHDTCYRRANFDAGLFAESFDDENARKGYCLYKLGCKGPTTYAACGIIGWNNKTSFPIQAGHPCIGCTEAGFWDNGPFYQRLRGVPGYPVEGNADKIGGALVGATVAGAVTHAVLTNVRKRKDIGEQPGENAERAEREDTPSGDAKTKT